MNYDVASWHYEGQFPDDLPPVAGATHIGMFAAWAILSDLAVEPRNDNDAAELKRLRSYELTPGRWLFDHREGTFASSDLGEEGQAFAEAYYANAKGPREGRNSYFADYQDVFKAGDNIYRVEDRWSNFYHLRSRLDARLAMFRQFGHPFVPEGEAMQVDGKLIGSSS